jgi:hypothetical protein
MHQSIEDFRFLDDVYLSSIPLVTSTLITIASDNDIESRYSISSMPCNAPTAYPITFNVTWKGSVNLRTSDTNLYYDINT